MYKLVSLPLCERCKIEYGGWGPEHLMRFYRDDLARAKALGAHYVVFHVTDVSIEETYTYQWEHTHQEVIDTAAEIINGLLAGGSWPFEFLMENLWWPGFTMTDPEQTAYLLDAVRYPKRGIMLDTGHLMNTNPDLRSEAEGGAYNHSVLGAYGDLCRGFHFNQSLSGGMSKRTPAPCRCCRGITWSDLQWDTNMC